MRPGPWGNPFVIGTHGTREQCCDLHEEWLKGEPELLQELWRLRGKHLICACRKSQRCHGDTLRRVAAFTPEQLMDWMLGFDPLDDL